MRPIFIYSDKQSSRLVYVLDWLFNDCLKKSYTLVHSVADIPSDSFFISYGKQSAEQKVLSIPDAGLLWEKGIEQYEIKTGAWNNIPTLYAIANGSYTLPFDLFSAIFFLLSRYEEYYAFTPDKYVRYPATDSILYKNGWLLRPLIDEWLLQLRTILLAKYGQQVGNTSFSFQPTYDIDIAYSYLHKGSIRTIGAAVRDAIKGTGLLQERISTLAGKRQDPYDSFDWLQKLHTDNHCKPIYFMLSSLKTTAYDKNIYPLHIQMQQLTKRLADEGAVGIHPSYFSGENEILRKEKETLENIIFKKVNISRQHYIRIKTPDTYRLLIQNGITDDYSMGYGTHFGFRAGTGNAFSWYDVENESATALRIHPFCFMDTTGKFEEKLSPVEAFEKLKTMKTVLEQTGSTLITIFHNFSLGTAAEWKGWKAVYANFISEIMS